MEAVPAKFKCMLEQGKATTRVRKKRRSQDLNWLDFKRAAITRRNRRRLTISRRRISAAFSNVIEACPV
jgi:hypothetical protein